MILGKHVQSKAYHGRKSGQSTTKGVIESERRENSTRKIDIEDFFFLVGGGGGRKMPVLVHGGQIPQPL